MPWSFESSVSKDRQREMFGLRSFDDVLGLVGQGEVESLCLESKGHGDCAGARRVLCVLSVGARAYDAFLNAPVGVRAHYALSPSAGDEATRAAIERLRPRLLSHPLVTRLPLAEQQLARRSIESSEARIWVNDRDWLTSGGPDLTFGPWADKAAAAGLGSVADQHARGLALNGVMAPQGTSLEFKGGWQLSTGASCIDSSKANRAALIHEYGSV
jgi:hypothetical protein